MMKKGYRARRKKSSFKNKEESRRCFKCGSKDYLVAECPYNSDNGDDKKNKKKDKKEKKEKDKITFKKKNGSSYVVTWDSDASSSDDDSDDDKTTKKRHLQALQSMRSLLSSTLCHASWLRPLRYKFVMMEVMMNMIMKMKMIVIVIVMMMNLLRMNYLTC